MTTELYVSSILSHQVGDRNLSFFTSQLLALIFPKYDRPYLPKARSPLIFPKYDRPYFPISRSYSA
ncbi:hypothetical protein [Microcoleus sp. D3_18a_C4]|uniref:hypothetical protein n=1 Tax=Microcoleus sp. D3_18a_C4 TaxID=3055332 RepID=UPI002FD5D5D9